MKLNNDIMGMVFIEEVTTPEQNMLKQKTRKINLQYFSYTIIYSLIEQLKGL